MDGTTGSDGDVERELRDHDGELQVLLIRRSYDAHPEEVWDALTDPERIVRWFLPVTGDLREGGSYRLEGNAGGRILRCDPPREIMLTWEFGEFASEVRLRLSPSGERTVLELRHSPVPVEIITNAGEIWGLGAGWEIGLAALGDFLAGRLPPGRGVDIMAAASPERLAEFVAQAERISAAWRAVIAARPVG